ncbi:MAG: ABC transporter permease subunit, partial [Thiohalocapsa sp.]
MKRRSRDGYRSRGWTGWNDPRVRALLIQVLFIGAVLALAAFILHNTLANLESRGIGTGFGFLSTEAGFGIIQTLIDYSETSSFGRTFLGGVLNTLLVSLLGILLATIFGLVIGVARLSSNWLVARLAAVYVETFRNIPLLLQIFFWYFAVLRALPKPRESLALGDAVFLNLRGLYLPRPLFEPGFGWVLAAMGCGALGALALGRWA